MLENSKKLEKWTYKGLKDLIKESILLTNFRENIIEEQPATYISRVLSEKIDKVPYLIMESTSFFDYLRKKDLKDLDPSDLNRVWLEYEYYKQKGDLRMLQLFLHYLNSNENKKDIYKKIKNSLEFNYYLSSILAPKTLYIEEGKILKEIIVVSKEGKLDYLLNKAARYLRKF
jgi:hypothetical protein